MKALFLAFSLCPHVAEKQGEKEKGKRKKKREREREKERDRDRDKDRKRERSASFYKATVLSDMDSTPISPSNLNYLLKILSLYTITLEVRISTYKFWSEHSSVLSILPEFESPDSNVNFTELHAHRHIHNNVWPNIWAPSGPVRLSLCLT